MYHLLVLVDLVDALNITPPGDPFEDVLRPAIERMHRFAAACATATGRSRCSTTRCSARPPAAPRSCDTPSGSAGSRPMAHRMPDSSPSPTSGCSASGIAPAACGWMPATTGPPFLQAHAHADTGSFELSVGACRVVCDSGVFSYQDPARRAWDRSTPAHSTVSVAGESSSDCWGSFRVARRARIRALDWTERGGEQSVRFRHDGFRHLPASPRHERTVTFREGTYTIRDRIVARSETELRCDGFLYLGPGVTVLPLESIAPVPDPPRTWSFELRHEADPHLRVRVDVSILNPDGPRAVFVEPARFAPRFHTDLPGHRIRAAGLATTREFGIEWRLSIDGHGCRDRGRPCGRSRWCDPRAVATGGSGSRRRK